MQFGVSSKSPGYLLSERNSNVRQIGLAEYNQQVTIVVRISKSVC